MGHESESLSLLIQAIEKMREEKPEERSEKARRYAVAITELEKLIAYFKVYVEYADG
jgi:hypothetical protein